MAASGSGYLSRPSPSGLADVVEIVLDRGIVIDLYLRISLLGIELVTVDARVVVASVDTYLRFAEATNRLDIDAEGARKVPELLVEGVESTVKSVAANVVEDKVEGGIEAVGDKVEAVVDKVEAVGEKIGDVAEKAIDVITPGSEDR